jgi:hypothetical protein
VRVLTQVFYYIQEFWDVIGQWRAVISIAVVVLTVAVALRISGVSALELEYRSLRLIIIRKRAASHAWGHAEIPRKTPPR